MVRPARSLSPPSSSPLNGHSTAAPRGLHLNGYRSANLNRYTTSSRIYRWHTAAFHEALYDLLAEAEPRTVLDAGCGEGLVADLLASRNPNLRITGVDKSAEAVAFARKHFGHAAAFRTGSLLDLPFEDDAFDLVLCSEVLEHLDEPGQALEELKRVASKHVLITVPREPVFKMLNDAGQALGLCGDPGHVQFWTKNRFQEYFGPHFARTTFRWKHTYQLVLGELA